MAKWVIKAHPEFLTTLYTLPRGEAVKVTEGIRPLADNPTPPEAKPVPDRPGRFTLTLDVYMVIYEVNAEQSTVRLLVLSRVPRLS